MAVGRTNPLVQAWFFPDKPLPQIQIRSAMIGNPTAQTGLHFPQRMSALIADIAQRVDTFRHLEPRRILIGFCRSRKKGAAGLQARITPMRFENGEIQTKRGNKNYQVQRYFVDHLEMLYLLSFCVPRFLNRPIEQQWITIFHELYHIHERFNGDLRRHSGRGTFHTASQKQYDAHMAHLVEEYLGTDPDPQLHSFLGKNVRELLLQHGSIVGNNIPRPKMLLVQP